MTMLSETGADERLESGDRFTPLVVSPVGPRPVPVRTTDGRDHLLYELSVLNCSARPATITSVAVIADRPGGDRLAHLDADTVLGYTLIVGNYAAAAEPIRSLPPGRTLVVIMDVLLEVDRPVPERLVHEVSAEFGALEPGQAAYAENFPAAVTQLGGIVAVDHHPVITIGAPLDGGSWWAANASGSMNPHRGALIPVGGRLNPAERYAIDWVRVDPDARQMFDPATGLAATFSGPPSSNASYYTWDQLILAVADGEVVTVLDELPDAPPQAIMAGLPLDQLGGNHVVLRIADGVYAFYAHLKAGSVSVAVGDRVERGRPLARAGNSGSSTEAHLHFHVMNSPYPLDADNLPFVLDRFSYDGTITASGIAAEPGDRHAELPSVNSVITFPLSA